MDRIYLDNAATSWPKPESVYAAIEHAQRVVGAPAGRGGYQQAVESQRLVEQTRGLVAELIGAPNRNCVAFTFNCTDSLSTALFGLLKQGDHVVTSVVEHNSVLRPLKDLEARRIIEVDFIECDQTGLIDEDKLISAIRPDTRLVCLNHVSNVTGTIEPVTNIKSRLTETGNKHTLLLVDAAQSLGHLDIDVDAIGCDILAASGHKGIMGPLGTGILYVAEPIADEVRPLRFGGTGTDGSIELQPTRIPDKFESGNLNVPGIAGIHAGIQFLLSDEGMEATRHHESLSAEMLDGLLNIRGVKLFGPETIKQRVGVFSITIDGLDSHDAASILDGKWCIQTRAGLHCAPLLHRTLGTEQSNGTLRLSVGLFNTQQHVQKAIDAITQLANI